MRVSQSDPKPFYCDKKSVIQITHNLIFNERTKHIKVECHFVHHHLHHDTLTLPHISSSLQLADFFTKSYIRSQFNFCWTNFQCLL